DLGEQAVLPGLINSHCHLDYTAMAGKIPPTKYFSDWIKALLALKAHWSFTEYAQSWLEGARMLARYGVTTVADIESVPELIPDAWLATPLRVISFFEMTGVKSRREPQQILDEALEKIASLPRANGRCAGALSPHAPYSTQPELLRLTAAAAKEQKHLVSIHVAESEEEFDMFMHPRGMLYTWLKTQRPMNDCGQVSPVQHLNRCGLLGPNLLAIHANYLAPGDAALLGQTGTTVVHCPRSHAYFRHQRFPRSEYSQHQVNVCLGTDSLVTVLKAPSAPLELNLFAEMQMFAAQFPEISPRDILQMVTINAAHALHRQGDLGAIVPGASADLIAVPFAGPDTDTHIFESIVHHQGPVAACMIDGEWVTSPA
ncbi:MAG: amidohydrolase family protein, partial [Verrucomicrobiota bacterium]